MTYTANVPQYIIIELKFSYTMMYHPSSSPSPKVDSIVPRTFGKRKLFNCKMIDIFTAQVGMYDLLRNDTYLAVRNTGKVPQSKITSAADNEKFMFTIVIV